MKIAVAIAILAATGGPASAQDVKWADPEPRMLLQYAETLGKLNSCGQVGVQDRTEEIAAAMAERSLPGLWDWLGGAQGAMRDELIDGAVRAQIKAMSNGCTVAPLQDAYRSILVSIERSLL